MPPAASTEDAQDEDPASHLTAVLRVEDVGEDLFLGRCPVRAFDRIYGGQLAAQAFLAATRTVAPDFVPVSSHVNFLRIGIAREPITYSVEHVTEGRSLVARLVRAVQNGRLLSLSTVSYQRVSTEHDRLDHHTSPGHVPPPESRAVRDEELVKVFGDRVTNTMVMPSWPVEIRYVDRSPWEEGTAEPRNRLWMKSLVPLPDDRLVHCAALLYAGDLHLPEPILFPTPLPWVDLVNSRGFFGASLDYTVWFHRPFQFDDWLLHEQESLAIANSRGLTFARWRSPDGEIVASAAEVVGILDAEGR